MRTTDLKRHDRPICPSPQHLFLNIMISIGLSRLLSISVLVTPMFFSSYLDICFFFCPAKISGLHFLCWFVDFVSPMSLQKEVSIGQDLGRASKKVYTRRNHPQPFGDYFFSRSIGNIPLSKKYKKSVESQNYYFFIPRNHRNMLTLPRLQRFGDPLINDSERSILVDPFSWPHEWYFTEGAQLDQSEIAMKTKQMFPPLLIINCSTSQ